MQRAFIIMIFCSVAGMSIPSAFDEYVKQARSGPETIEAGPAVVPAALPVTAAPTLQPIGRTLMLDEDGAGHFRTDALMNGIRLDSLVDTGASYVAIDETTARRIGIHLAPSDWRHAVQTANGQAMAASAIIELIEIGPVTARDVEAMVLKDGTLGINLLGMSFLKRLDRFSIENGRLTLAQ